MCNHVMIFKEKVLKLFNKVNFLNENYVHVYIISFFSFSSFFNFDNFAVLGVHHHA
jgi:hypothetical protein